MDTENIEYLKRIAIALEKIVQLLDSDVEKDINTFRGCFGFVDKNYWT